MPQFKATATKYTPGERPRNPFLVRDIFSSRWAGTTERRTWEFDAADEAEVRRLFAEAQSMGVEQVVGFALESVTPV